jgi:hypothetical protein
MLPGDASARLLVIAIAAALSILRSTSDFAQARELTVEQD